MKKKNGFKKESAIRLSTEKPMQKKHLTQGKTV